MDTSPDTSSLESSYYAHMGFDPAHARKVRAHYVPLLAGSAPVLELGCGRGEFLALLAEQGVSTLGVDSDEGMVAEARRAGLDVELADAVGYVGRDPRPGPFGGVFCAHLLEHLVPEDALRLLTGVGELLVPGGLVVVVVPNPACYAVLTHDFWRDPTHVRFYDLPLVEFLCAQAGLVVEASGPNPADHPGPPPGLETQPPALGDDMGPVLAEVVAALRAEPQGWRRVARRVVGGGETLARLAGLVEELAGRLRRADEAVRELARAHNTVVWALYEPNEVYVVARRPPAGA